MTVGLNVRFYPNWFHAEYGMTFGRRYAQDLDYRVALGMEQQRLVAQRFGNPRLGAAEPSPEPNLPAIWKNVVAVMFGARLNHRDEDDGWIEPGEVSLEQIAAAKVPDVENDPHVVEIVRQAKAFESQHGPAVWNPGIDGVLNVAAAVCGEQFFEWLVLEPEAASRFLAALRETSLRLHEHMRKLCGHPAPMGLGNCSLCMIRPELYLQAVMPHDLPWCRRAEELGLPFGFHMDGKIDRYLDVIATFPHLSRVDMGCDSDIALARRVLGDRTLRIYLYPHALEELGASQIGDYLAKLIAANGDGPIVLQLDVSRGMRDETVAAVVEFAAERGA